MKKATLIGYVFLVIGCSSSSKNGSEETILRGDEMGMEAKKTSDKMTVLNPNLASKSQLLEMGITDVEAEQLLSGKPYLDPSSFLNMLKDLVGEEDFERVKSGLFLPMNLNTTPEEQFMWVPKVGKKMAHEFEEYRPYISIEQFRREIGKYVSEDQVAAYEMYVFVPVNLNTASKEEILGIPGVGEKMLHEFEEYRPYKNMEQFRREIGKYVDENEMARLERYVTL